MDVLAVLHLDVITLLSDELSAGAGGNRRRLAVQRSLRWLDTCLRDAAARPALAATSCLVGLSSGLVWSLCHDSQAGQSLDHVLEVERSGGDYGGRGIACWAGEGEFVLNSGYCDWF